jgi:hypothetical protein
LSDNVVFHEPGFQLAAIANRFPNIFNGSLIDSPLSDLFLHARETLLLINEKNSKLAGNHWKS